MSHALDDVTNALMGKRSVVITAHQRPDGDAVGAALALRRILADCGIRARVVFEETLPYRYQFLADPGEVEIAAPGWLGSAEALICLDCGAFDRLGEFSAEAFKLVQTINIDHHGSNTLYGDINWVDPHASSVGEMIYRLAKSSGYAVSKKAAEAIWVAIVTDTGKFAYENTTADTLRTGAELVELGVSPAAIEAEVFQSVSLKELKVNERAIHNLELLKNGKVGVVTMSRADFAEIGCGPEYCQDVVNLARNIRGVEIALFFYQLPDGQIKASVRAADPYDAVELCATFGGGGHKRAAGCSLDGNIEDVKREVIEMMDMLWFSDSNEMEGGNG
jgi:phosphoesterase RecJ-like protein